MYNSSDPLKQFITKIIMPLTTFRMNQTTRLSNDVAIFISKTASNEDRATAGRSLVGFAAEMATFRLLKLYIGYYLFYSLAQFIRGEEDDEEEKKKKWDNMVKGAATSVATDVLSPAPVFDIATNLATNFTLDQIQAIYGIDKEERFNLFTEKNQTAFESFLSDLGIFGIPIVKAKKLYEDIELGVTGKFKKEYFGKEVEMYIKEKDKELLSNPMYISLGIATALGINPLGPETSNVMNTMVKSIKRDAMTEGQIEKEKAYKGYKTIEEFKENDPEGYIEADNDPESPLNKKRAKDKKEREDKEREEYFEKYGEYPPEKTSTDVGFEKFEPMKVEKMKFN
jgi:hypothetical protein